MKNSRREKLRDRGSVRSNNLM